MNYHTCIESKKIQKSLRIHWIWLSLFKIFQKKSLIGWPGIFECTILDLNCLLLMGGEMSFYFSLLYILLGLMWEGSPRILQGEFYFLVILSKEWSCVSEPEYRAEVVDRAPPTQHIGDIISCIFWDIPDSEHSTSLGPYILSFCLENIISPPCHELHTSATLTGSPRPTPALLFYFPAFAHSGPSAGNACPPLCPFTSFSPFFNISSKKVCLIFSHPSLGWGPLLHVVILSCAYFFHWT